MKPQDGNDDNYLSINKNQIGPTTNVTLKSKIKSLEDAIKECKECGSDCADCITNSEYISETEELIPPDKEATIEVMDRSYNVIGSNL